MVVLGVVLIVLGVGFLLVALGGAARAVLTASATKERGLGASFDPEKWSKLVSAVNETIKLAGAWVAAAIVGGVLLAAGGYLLDK